MKKIKPIKVWAVIGPDKEFSTVTDQHGVDRGLLAVYRKETTFDKKILKEYKSKIIPVLFKQKLLDSIFLKISFPPPAIDMYFYFFFLHISFLIPKVLTSSHSFVSGLKCQPHIQDTSCLPHSLQRGSISGNTIIGSCPFHEDRTPSFTIYKDQNSWFCYGCSQGGSVVDYIMIRDRVEFLEAVKILVNK